MNAPSAYFGGRTSLGSESRRSLMRVRQQQQEEEKNAKKLTKTKATPAPVRQRVKRNENVLQIESFSRNFSLAKVMNLVNRWIRNRHHRQRKNLLEKVQTIEKRRRKRKLAMSFHRVVRNRRVNRKVKHPMTKRPVHPPRHHRHRITMIIRRIERKLLPLPQRKNRTPPHRRRMLQQISRKRFLNLHQQNPK